MIKVITSKDNSKVKYACSLKESKYRKQNREFLGESLKSLELAIKANLVKEVFTYEALDIPEDIFQYLVNEDVMKKISGTTNPEGVVFIAKMPEIKKENYTKILYLDHINDPGNMGTMIRTALAFKFDAVIVSEDSVSIYNEKTLAACKGANYLIPVFVDDIYKYKKDHVMIASTLSDTSVDVSDLDEDNERIILVVGNEARGISEGIKNNADIFVKIPISNIDSLNVSVAAAILMYELSK